VGAAAEEPMTLTRVRTNEPVELTISFDAGLPVAVDGVALSLATSLRT